MLCFYVKLIHFLFHSDRILIRHNWRIDNNSAIMAHHFEFFLFVLGYMGHPRLVFIVYVTDIFLEVSWIELLFIPPSHTAFAAVTILAGEHDGHRGSWKKLWKFDIRSQKRICTMGCHSSKIFVRNVNSVHPDGQANWWFFLLIIFRCYSGI